MSFNFTVSPSFPSERISDWYIFNPWLQCALSLPIHLELYNSFGAQRAAITEGKVDLIHANPFDASQETGFTGLAKNHLAFTAFHVHPLIIGLVFGNMNWSYGLFWYVGLVLSALFVLRSRLYLHRPLALGISMTAILVNSYIVHPIIGFEWMIPALFLKIIYGHLVREEPYRPA